MGTRHLICVVKGGQYRVAQYGQWDGYFEGQGNHVIRFLLTADMEKFSSQVDKIKVLTESEADARFNAAPASDSFRGPSKVLHLTRDCGSKILAYVQTTEAPEVWHSLDFAADSLFCEFAYVVNLDSQSLECFKGFNKSPLAEGERFYGFENREGNKDDFARRVASGKAYYPVKHFRTIPFAELNENTVTELVEQLRVEEQAEELIEQSLEQKPQVEA